MLVSQQSTETRSPSIHIEGLVQIGAELYFHLGSMNTRTIVGYIEKSSRCLRLPSMCSERHLEGVFGKGFQRTFGAKNCATPRSSSKQSDRTTLYHVSISAILTESRRRRYSSQSAQYTRLNQSKAAQARHNIISALRLRFRIVSSHIGACGVTGVTTLLVQIAFQTSPRAPLPTDVCQPSGT